MFNALWPCLYRLRASAVAPAVMCVMAACASAGAPPIPHAADVPLLEDRRNAAPAEVDLQVRLGTAYRAAGRLDEARAALEQARARNPNHPGAVLFLGLVYEDLYQFREARELYQTYLVYGPPSAVKADLRGRLPLLRQREFAAAARQALAREAELTNTPPRPHTVAVFPFLYQGQDSTLRPLGRALAELLVTDLSQTERLTVLERARVQLLLNEMRVKETDWVEPGSAVRTGRLLGAEHVVQGAISTSADRLALRAIVIRVDSAEAAFAAAASLTEHDAATQVLDAGKRLALRIYQTLGVQLTPAERERVNQRATDNFLALLAYGLGLEAVDGGNFSRAAEHFARAAALDPGFFLAVERAERAAAAAAASRMATDQLALVAWVTYAPISAAAVPPPGLPELIPRDPVSEALGQEGLARGTGIIELILRLP